MLETQKTAWGLRITKESADAIKKREIETTDISTIPFEDAPRIAIEQAIANNEEALATTERYIESYEKYIVDLKKKQNRLATQQDELIVAHKSFFKEEKQDESKG